jgi:uncharacterized protein YbgA (DUF1722 family)/uncharacterized protein YbbK (DUF523 family)
MPPERNIYLGWRALHGSERDVRAFARPRVVVSRCLGFDHCRWNGEMITSEVVRMIAPYVDFLPACAEVEIGLGVPRKPVRIVREQDGDRLVQHETGLDVTGRMERFAASFAGTLREVDGFLLKSRSPSCGIRDAKVYRAGGTGDVLGKTAGVFAAAMAARFPHLPAEDEGRLRNRRIREHFLTRLFTLAAFREVRAGGDLHELAAFHTANKLLLMAYSQKEMRELGRIVANPEREAFPEVAQRYGDHMNAALSRAPRYTANINVLLHALGRFRGGLSPAEKTFFLDTLEQYRLDRVTICPNLTILRGWIVRFGDDYLREQTFFSPFPAELMGVSEDLSHNQRDYRDT